MEPEEVRELRKALGLTLEALARELGVSFSTVQRWETGKSKPSPLARGKLEKLRAKAKKAAA